MTTISSWGHYLRPAEPSEIKQRDRDIAWANEPHETHERDQFEAWRLRVGHCKVRGCSRLWTHFYGFQYVTGRAGRVSYQERRVCETHGLKAIRKAEAKAGTK